MQQNAKKEGGTVSRLSVWVSKSSKSEICIFYIEDSMRASIENRPTKEREALDRMKRQSWESSTYKGLNDE